MVGIHGARSLAAAGRAWPLTALLLVGAGAANGREVRDERGGRKRSSEALQRGWDGEVA